MGALAMPFQNLPLGFRFKPTDVELIDHYLRLKVNGKHEEVACITEVDICKVEPWDLPDLSAIKTNDHEWFFFCPRDRKYPNGQRSNRATGAGYWKATGKDRTIKSRKMGLIGMKKTLVFYTGRAPKGQRTNWVIHEYRTTLDELDGTQPGQEAFVLCRLFKKADDLKQDDNDEGSNLDEVETNLCSPNLTIISQEDVPSEPAVVQASPVSVGQTVEQPIIAENYVVKTSDSMTSDHSFSNGYDITRREYQDNEEMIREVDSHINEAMEYFYDPQRPHFPPHQMNVNQGPLSMEPLFTPDIGDGRSGLDVNERDPISDFLDSILINPDDEPLCKETGNEGGPPFVGSKMWDNGDDAWWKDTSVKESGSCSGSDVEVAQLQPDVGFINSITSDKYCNESRGNNYHHSGQNHSFADNDEIFSDDALNRFCNIPSVGDQIYYAPPVQAKIEDVEQNLGTGIKIRRQPRKLLQSSNFTQQGTAHRRIRLQLNLGETKNEEDKSEATITKAEGQSSPSVAPVETYCIGVSEKSTAVGDERDSSSDDDDGEVVETGIKIRTRLRKSNPSGSSFVDQGTARRRLRLQKTFDSKAQEDDEAKVTIAQVKSLSKEGGEKPSSHKSPVSYLYMLKVVFMVFFLIMAFVGLWKGQNVIL